MPIFLFPVACLAGVGILSVLDVLATERGQRPGPARERAVERRCPYCHDEIELGGSLARCKACATEHHEECWTDNARCSVFGCESKEKVEKPVELASLLNQEAAS